MLLLSILQHLGHSFVGPISTSYFHNFIFDGSALFAEFSQLFGNCSEGRSEYITDGATGCAKLGLCDMCNIFYRLLSRSYFRRLVY